MHAVAPSLPLIDATLQTSQIARSTGRERTFAQVSAAFGLLALLLACIGLHGTLGYAVARRTPEIGIRLALGATRGAILRMILRDALLIVGLGLAAGLGAGLLTTRFLERWLFGLTPTDAATLAGAALVLLAMTLVAGLLPARRAAKVEPVRALRSMP